MKSSKYKTKSNQKSSQYKTKSNKKSCKYKMKNKKSLKLIIIFKNYVKRLITNALKHNKKI